MNGVHDMGGMHGFGPVVAEPDEPVFHARWEADVLVMRRILGSLGKINLEAFRPAIESIPPVDYLRNSYYKNWFTALVKQLIDNGLVTAGEIAAGKAAAVPEQRYNTLTPAEAAVLPFHMPASALETERAPRFSIGQRVRARNMHPAGHTRLPRYVRGKAGFIARERSVQAFPDTDAYELGTNAQRVYCVRFLARELWGEQACPRDSLYLDLWEDYLDAS